MSAAPHLINNSGYIVAAVVATAVGLAGMLILPDPTVLIAVTSIPIALLLAIWLKDYPFELCLTFIIFSFFRIHEAFPVLYPFRIPQFLAIMTLSTLAWHYIGTRRINSFWTTELIIFFVFFVHCSIGVLFATNRPEAISYWSDSYVKIAIIVFATAWLTSEPRHFSLVSKAVVLAGIAISSVAIYNKENEIGLVEGTRVTIGRDFGSNLGDPNDLSLVLLFPFSFSFALLVTKGIGRWQRLIGLIATPMALFAILATQSRGGLLGVVAVMGVMSRYKIKSNLVMMTLAGVGLIGLFALAGISGRSSGGAGETGIDESADGRLYAWGAAFRMALRFPIFGVGLNNFLSNYFDYSNLHDGFNHAVHSTWFGVMAETGFVGFFVFLALISLTLRTAIITSRLLEKSAAPIATRAFSQALVAGLVATCVSGSFLTQGFTWPFYIYIAMVVALARYTHTIVGMRGASPLPFEHRSQYAAKNGRSNLSTNG